MGIYKKKVSGLLVSSLLNSTLIKEIINLKFILPKFTYINLKFILH